MKNTIIKYIKSIGVSVSLRFKAIDGLLTYYVADWLGTDKKYYSLLVICNETQIFASNNLGLTCEEIKSDELKPASRLTANLRQFDEKLDWALGQWDLEQIKSYDAFLKKSISEFTLDDCDTEDCTLDVFSISLHPIVQFIIGYTINEDKKTIALSLGNEAMLLVESTSEQAFIQNVINALSLEKYYSVEVKPCQN